MIFANTDIFSVIVKFMPFADHLVFALCISADHASLKRMGANMLTFAKLLEVDEPREVAHDYAYPEIIADYMLNHAWRMRNECSCSAYRTTKFLTATCGIAAGLAYNSSWISDDDDRLAAMDYWAYSRGSEDEVNRLCKYDSIAQCVYGRKSDIHDLRPRMHGRSIKDMHVLLGCHEGLHLRVNLCNACSTIEELMWVVSSMPDVARNVCLRHVNGGKLNLPSTDILNK